MGRQAHRPQGDALTRRFGGRQTATADDVVELARRARGGDRQALEPLVRATYPDALGLAMRMLGDEHDARDAVQEAFVRALCGIRRFRGDAAFTTWLHRITANCAADVLAGRARTAHQDLDTLAPEHHRALADTSAEHDPERRSVQRADRDRLVAALQALPARLRAVVVLRDVYDLSHEAIAAELGISVAAAKVRLHRGRRRLRDDLFPVPGAGDGASTDGASTGGASTGGASTDGASTDGASTDGASTDGATADGGTAHGGTDVEGGAGIDPGADGDLLATGARSGRRAPRRGASGGTRAAGTPGASGTRAARAPEPAGTGTGWGGTRRAV